MPGILGYCSPYKDRTTNGQTIGVMLGSLIHQSWYKVSKAQSSYGYFACIHHGTFNHGVVAMTEDTNVGVVLDGWIHTGYQGNQDTNTSDSLDIARWCMEQYMDRGINFVSDLNGQFNLIVWDNRSDSVYLINDRYGTRPIQYSIIDEKLYFAPEAKSILATGGLEKNLNLKMVVNHLSWGRVGIGNDTFFDGIKILPPASILHWRRGKITLDQYWDYKYSPIDQIDDDFVGEVAGIFKRAVDRHTNAGLQYGVSLTGGLDSRSVLAALVQKPISHKNITAYTWGTSEYNDEIAIAKQVADQLGSSWNFVKLTPTDFIKHAPDGVCATEGLDLLVQSHGLSVYPSIREDKTDALLTGLAMDITLGGSYLDDSIMSPDTTDKKAISYVLNKSQYFSSEETIQLMSIGETGDILDVLRTEAIGELGSSNLNYIADRCDRFFLRSRVSRILFTRQAWQRMYMEDVIPTFDNEFIDCVLNIPYTERFGHKFYRKFLQKLEPSMMNVPYQGTMLPPSAPLEFWRKATQIERQREELYRLIWQSTEGKVLVPFSGYFTNYDEWLRTDPGWIKFTDELLTRSSSVICDRLVNAETVRQIVDVHRSGIHDNHKQILQLLTLELLLRRLFA
tara:strand:+ start:795 stop:2660 length:1866 start_codon:yes stop_codon:yes gene_type:complete